MKNISDNEKLLFWNNAQKVWNIEALNSFQNLEGAVSYAPAEFSIKQQSSSGSVIEWTLPSNSLITQWVNNGDLKAVGVGEGVVINHNVKATYHEQATGKAYFLFERGNKTVKMEMQWEHIAFNNKCLLFISDFYDTSNYDADSYIQGIQFQIYPLKYTGNENWELYDSITVDNETFRGWLVTDRDKITINDEENNIINQTVTYYSSTNVWRNSTVTLTQSPLLMLMDEEAPTYINDDLLSESFSLEEMLVSSQNLKFGELNSATVKFEAGKGRTIGQGQVFRITLFTSDIENGYGNMHDFGCYITDEAENKANSSLCEIVAYDFKSQLDKSCIAYLKHLINKNFFPMQPKELIYLLLLNYGFKVEYDLKYNFFDLNIPITAEMFEEMDDITGRELLSLVLEPLGVFCSSFNKTLKIFNLKTNEEGYDIEFYDPSETVIQEYDALPISQVVFNNNESYITAGEGTNRYVISYNPILEKIPADLIYPIITRFYGATHIKYRPYSITTAGMPYFELGDKINLKTTYIEAPSYIFQRKLSGCQGLEDVYEATGDYFRSDIIEEKKGGGKDGKTPVKGEDYYTPEEVEDMKAYCREYIEEVILYGAS